MIHLHGLGDNGVDMRIGTLLMQIQTELLVNRKPLICRMVEFPFNHIVNEFYFRLMQSSFIMHTQTDQSASPTPPSPQSLP